MPSPASSPAIRRYPQCSLSAAMRSTRRTMRRWVGGRPGRFGLDLAAQRRRTISRCQRKIVPGVMNKCSALWRERGMSVSSTANRARSVHVSFGRAAIWRCRTASWWRSRRISASFHAGGRLDSRSHAGIWTARRNTKRRHTRCDHRRPACLTASRHPRDDLAVRGFRQAQVQRQARGVCPGGCHARPRVAPPCQVAGGTADLEAARQIRDREGREHQDPHERPYRRPQPEPVTWSEGRHGRKGTGQRQA
jgi:hypothetical protein